MSSIKVITITADDLRAAPAWLLDLINQWAPPDQFPSWEIEVYVELYDDFGGQDILLHFDVTTPAGSVLATGEHFPFCRHLSKGNLGAIARGAVLSHDKLDHLIIPAFLIENTDSTDGFRNFPEEMAWLYQLSPETVKALLEKPDFLQQASTEEILKLMRDMNPGIDEAWSKAFTEALTAANLL